MWQYVGGKLIDGDQVCDTDDEAIDEKTTIINIPNPVLDYSVLVGARFSSKLAIAYCLHINDMQFIIVCQQKQN